MISRWVALRLVALAVTSALWSPAAAELVVVEPGASGVTALQAAIDAASDGDVLLLAPGNWEPLVGQRIGIVGKGLTLAPVGGTRQTLLGPVVISDVPGGSTVVLRRLSLSHALGALNEEPTLELTNCAGSIWVEQCAITGGDGSQSFIPFKGQPALRAQGCSAVNLERCELTGGRGGNATAFAQSWFGAAGLDATASTVVIHGSDIQGGSGGDGDPSGKGSAGGAGILGNEVTMFVAGGRSEGGHAGMDSTDQPGGDAIRIPDPFSLLRLADVELVPGRPSPGGQPGLPVDAVGFVVAEWDRPARGLSAPSPLREGQSASLSYQGRVRDIVGLEVGFDGAAQMVEAWQGAWVLQPAGITLVAGLVTAPDGAAVFALPLPHLPPGVGGLTVLLQAVVSPGGGPVVLAGGTALTWVPAGTGAP